MLAGAKSFGSAGRARLLPSLLSDSMSLVMQRNLHEFDGVRFAACGFADEKTLFVRNL